MSITPETAVVMATPEAAAPSVRPSRGRWARRTALGVGGGLVVMAVAICIGEALAWAFLAGPAQQGLARVLERPVALRAAAIEAPAPAPQAAASAAMVSAAPAGFALSLFGGIDLRLDHLAIAGPAWRPGEPSVEAHALRLQLRYRDLWRAAWGEPLRVQAVEAERLRLDLARLRDGRASWQVGTPPAAGAPASPRPVLEQLRVGDGRLVLTDALQDAQVTARFALRDGQRPAAAGPASPAGLQLEAQGRFQRLPLTVSLQTVGLLPWVAEDAASRAVPLTVSASVGRARLRFDGAVRDVQQLAGLDGRFTLAGPSLAAVGDVLGVTLPTTGAFTTRGALRKAGAVWQLSVDQAEIGRSRLHGELRYDPRTVPALLSGRIGGPRLLLADLGPAIGTAPAPSTPAAEPATPTGPTDRVLPQREFDLPSLRAMDADVAFAFDELDLGTARLRPLAPLRTHLVLKAGVLALRDIDARIADGRLQGLLSLDGRADVAVWRSDLRWSRVRIEQWLTQARAAGAPPYLSGRFDGRARLTGRGRSVAQILARLDGDLLGQVHDGRVSHLLVEGAGLDIAQGLGVFLRGDDALPMGCALADLRVAKGMVKPRAMVIDTEDSVLWVDGQVSLADERLDLRAHVAPRDFSPLTLRTPVQVQGRFGAPKVSLVAAPLAGKLAASVLLGLVNPLAALIPLIDLGSNEVPGALNAGCRRLAQRAALLRTPG